MPFITAISPRQGIRILDVYKEQLELFEDIMLTPPGPGATVNPELLAPTGLYTYMTPSEYSKFTYKNRTNDIAKAMYIYIPNTDTLYLLSSPIEDGKKKDSFSLFKPKETRKTTPATGGASMFPGDDENLPSGTKKIQAGLLTLASFFLLGRNDKK